VNTARDILIQNGDIVINVGFGDFAETDATAAMLQDILEEFNFTYFDDLDNPMSGSFLHQSIKAELGEDIVLLSAEMEVERLLKNNRLIDERSVEVSATANGKKIVISAGFTTKAGDDLKVEVEV